MARGTTSRLFKLSDRQGERAPQPTTVSIVRNKHVKFICKAKHTKPTFGCNYCIKKISFYSTDAALHFDQIKKEYNSVCKKIEKLGIKSNGLYEQLLSLFEKIDSLINIMEHET